MRKIKLNEINIKNECNEETFYQLYLKGLKKEIPRDEEFKRPSKEYEIFYLDILGGKIILLNKKYILKKDISNQELYYDYSIAYKIYNYLIEIYSGINDEMNEMNELYKDERMQKNEEIRILKLKDEELFSKDIQEYDVIYNSSIYKKYMQLQKENEDIKKQNNELLKQLMEKNNVGFFDRILNKISTKKLHK